MTVGMELTNQEKIRKLGEKEMYKIHGTIESRYYQTSGDERKKF